MSKMIEPLTTKMRIITIQIFHKSKIYNYINQINQKHYVTDNGYKDTQNFIITYNTKQILI